MPDISDEDPSDASQINHSSWCRDLFSCIA